MANRIVALYCRGREIGFLIFYRADMTRYGGKTIPGQRRGRGFENRIENSIEKPIEKLTEYKNIPYINIVPLWKVQMT